MRLGAVAEGGSRLLGLPADPARAPEPAERPRHLRVVDPDARTPAQRRRRARAVFMGGVATMTVIGFALVYLHVLLAQRQFRLDRLNSQLHNQQAAYQNLRLQVAQLGSPAQIVSTAEGHLGMKQPAKVIYLDPIVGPRSGGTSSGPAQTGAAQTGAAQSGAAQTGPAQTGAAPRNAGTPPPVGGVTGATRQGPTGDANWPLIKSQLAGTP